MKLTPEAMQERDAQGFLRLPRFFADAEIDPVRADFDALWREGRAWITVDDMDGNHRMRLRELSAEARRAHRFKVNDIYLTQASVRHLALNDRLVPLLRSLLGESPAVCNSLSLEYGTEQPDHVDSLFITPRTPEHLVAAWVALEDCAPESGLLCYWPGSRKITPYILSNGERHFLAGELDTWGAWMQSQLRERGLHPEAFQANKGDVFVWSARLLHSGGPIQDRKRTRRSVVFHYFSESDCRAVGARLVPASGGFWVKRSPQPIPGSFNAWMRRRGGKAARGLRRLIAPR